MRRQRLSSFVPCVLTEYPVRVYSSGAIDKMFASLLVLGYAAIAAAHGDHGQKSLSGPHESLWYNTLPGDGGKQVRFIPNSHLLP